MIIPFFIPHAGCRHQCVFCDQRRITGAAARPEPASIAPAVEAFLAANRGSGPVQVAFYGGSFTALPAETQLSYLEAVAPFMASGQVKNIRLSTRPDSITPEVLARLRAHHVGTIELGAQSMDDAVLARSARGHTAADTERASALIRQEGFSLGLQLMPGLPGDGPDLFRETVVRAIGLRPDFVRIYPALVVQGTGLEDLFRAKRYTPLTLDEAVAQCRSALLLFEEAGIEVVRVGLQPTRELERSGAIIAGPYHPAFRQLVESSRFLDRMRRVLRDDRRSGTSVTLFVHAADISSAIGQKRSNIDILKREFGLAAVIIAPAAGLTRGSVAPGDSPFGFSGNLV